MQDVQQAAELFVEVDIDLLLRIQRASPRLARKLAHASLIFIRKLHLQQSTRLGGGKIALEAHPFPERILRIGGPRRAFHVFHCNETDTMLSLTGFRKAAPGPEAQAIAAEES